MGEIADSLIEKMIWGCNDDYSNDMEYTEYRRREATEVAEERLRDIQEDSKAKSLNKGVIKW